jgi:hypothetical protein
MAETDNRGPGSSDNGFDWSQVEVPNFDEPTAENKAADPITDTVDSGDENPEQPQLEEVAPTTPEETGAPQPHDDDSGLGDTLQLDGVPEEYRSVVQAAIDAKSKQLQAGFTKKFQSLKQERTRLESLAKYVDETGSSADDVVKAAAAFRKLESAAGIKIMQGDHILYEAESSLPEEPDYNSMTPAEIAAHIKSEVAMEREHMLSEVQQKFAPIERERALANARSVGQAWRAQRKDIPDDVLNIAVAKAREFETTLPQKPDLASVEALDMFMEPFISLAQQMKASAAKPKTPPTSSRTEVPHKETKAPSRKTTNLADMAEEAARRAGFQDVTDLMSTLRDD